MKLSGKNKLMLLGLLAALGLGGGIYWQRGDSSSNQRLGKVKRGDVVQRVTVSGQVRPFRHTAFVAPYAGYISKIYVRVGQKVRDNDPVVSIKSSLQSPEPVFPLRAPFAGTVVDVAKMEGEYVNEKDAKDVIVRVDDLSVYYVIARAPELDASRIRKGMEAEIRVSALESGVIKGIVRDIDLSAQDADGWKSQQSTFNVRVEVIDPPEGLHSGQSAILDIVTSKISNVLFVEHEFLNQDGDKHFVIAKNGKKIPVETGRQSDTAMEIKSGLVEGQEIQQIDFLKILGSGAL
jgi:multidrug efflux pump subunit AcrA (membrane-fusion protein)